MGLQIKLPVSNGAELLTRYGPELKIGTLFVRTRAPKPAGTLVRFDFRFVTGDPALRGIGTVKAAQTEVENPQRPGMLLQFLGLEVESHALLKSIEITLALPVLKPPQPETRHAPVGSRPPPPPPKPVESGAPVAAAHPPSIAEPAILPLDPPPPAAPPPREATLPPPSKSRDPNDMLAFAGEEAAAPPVAETPPTPAVPPPPMREAPRVAPPVMDTKPAPPVVSAPPPVAAAVSAPPHKKPVRRGPVVGIDLGTTNSCVAFVHHNKAQVIPSREGYNTVPSVFAVNDKGRLLVGHPAKSQLLTNPRNTVYGAKRLIGRQFASPIVTQLRERFPYEIVEGPKGEAAVSVGGKMHTLQEVSSLVLKEVREIARAKLGQDVSRAVITVPAYYNDLQRHAVREAGELAGLYVEQIINEPTAAALAFGHGKHLEQRILVYDLGGGTFDVSVLELHPGNIYEVVSTGGDTFLGGVDFDLRVLDIILAKFEADFGKPFDGDRVALQRLLDASERAKMALSERTDHHVHVPFIAMDGDKPLNIDMMITRQQLVDATAPLIDRTLQVTTDVLAARKLKPTDIDEVLLVGGQSRMPLVRERLRDFFGKEPNKGVHPDEAVAVGAALLAHTIGTDSAETVVLLDVLPMSIGVGLPGGRFKKIIERNTTVPHTRNHTIATTKDNQTSLELQVFQGESDRAVENEYLGTITLDDLPKAARGGVKIDLTFRLSKESTLEILTREAQTGKETTHVLATRDTPEQLRKKLADTAPPPEVKVGIVGFFKRLFWGGKKK